MADRLSLEELKKKRQEGTHENTERKLNTRSAAITRESGGERKSLEELRQARMNRNASPDVSVFHNSMSRYQQEKPAGFDYALEKVRNTANTTARAMSKNGRALQGALDIAKRNRETKKKLDSFKPVYDSSNEDKTMTGRSREKLTPTEYRNESTGETMTVEDYNNAKSTLNSNQKGKHGNAVSSFKGARKRAIEEALQQQADTSWMPEKEPETAKEYADYIDKYYQSLSDPELASLSDEELSAKITSAKDEKEGNKDKLKNYEPVYGSFDSPVLARNITKDTKLAGYRNRLTGETMSAEEHDALEGNTAIDKYENEQSVRKNQKAIKKWSEDYAKLTPEQEQAVMQMYITDHDEEEATEQEQAIRDTIGSRDPFELEKAYNSAKENLESQEINADDMEEYYSWIHNRQIDTKKRRELEEETKQEGLKGFLINAKESATSVGDSLLSGADFVDQLGHSAKNYFGGDEAYTPYDPYSARFTQSRNRKREAVSNDIDSTIGKFVYDVGMSMADSAAAMATGSEPVSLGIMAASAGSQAYVDASERGVDTNKAAAIGIANAAAEAGFEKLSLDHLYGMAENPTKTTFKKKILDWAAQSGIEGSEEVFTDFADEAADRMINGGLSEYSTNVKEYMKNGMSEDEAKTAANEQFWNQVGQDFVAGAISGAVFGGVANTVNSVQYHKMGKIINQDNTMRDTILETAEKMPENSTAKQIADTVKADNITDSQMSQIIESMAKSEDVNLDKVITEGFVRKGAEQEQAQQQAQELMNNTADTSAAREDNAIENTTGNMTGRVKNAEGIVIENEKVAPVQPYSRNQTGVTAAVNRNTGKQDIVVEIAESTPEKTMVKLSDGRVVDYKTVEIGNPTMRNLYNFAATFDDTKAANAVIENYNGESMPTYLESTAVFYNAGKLGKTSYESIMNNPVNARIVSEMSPSTLLEMYYLGENSRNPVVQNSDMQQAVKMGTGSVIDNRLDKSDNRMKSVVEMVAKKTGLDIELNDELEHGENGNFQKALSRIALAKTTGKGNTTNEYTTLVHELGEFSEAYNHEGMQKVVDTVLNYVTTKEGAAYLTNAIEQYHKAYKTVEKGKTYEDSANEYVFDYVAGLFADQKGVEAFSKYMSENMTESQHKSILKTIADFFKGVYDKITSYLNDHVLSSTAKKALRADAEEAQRIRDMFLGELTKAQENYKRENVTAEKGETETIDISSKKTVSKDDKKNPFKTYSLNIEERLSGDELLNALDMIEEIKRAGGEVDEYGNVRLYHATNEKSAKKIREEKRMVAKEDGIFFSTKKDGQIVGYGKEILEFTIPVEKLVLDDDFGDELHFRLPLEKSWEYDVSDSLVIDGIQRMKTTDGGIRYSITIGSDGIERYALSNETKKLTFKERKERMLNIMREQYAGRTAKFVKNGHVYYALYDERGVRKGIYGDKKSSKKGLKAKINIGAEGEYIELAENSIYTGSKTEIGKTNRFHRDAKTWDYYIKTIEFEGDYFDVLINVKDTGNEHYVYDVTLKEADSLPNPQRLYDGSKTASGDSISQNRKNATTFSLDVDSEGRKLSEEQKEYFKDSIVRDENGNLLTMYHGTPNGDFTVFKNDIQFFTPNRWYADFYQEPSASSRKAGKTVTNKKTYEVYLNITKPFDIRNPETKEIFINDYVKGGYALGINPYEEYKDTTNSGLPSWEEADNIYEFLEDNDLLDEYDGIIVDEGGFPGEDGKIVQRGISYVTFSQNQIKNVDNKKPTADPDIRHSVDIDEDLMAILEEEYSDTEKEMGSIIEDGFKALENVSIDDKTMRKIASEVKQEYKSTYNAKELADNLTKVFAYLKDTKNVSYEDMVRIVQEIAMPVIEESTDVDSVEADVYNSFRKTLRGQKIRLNEAQKKEVAHYYDSYDKFRKMNFGNITFSEDGMYLDSLWDELCQSSNYILDMDTAVNDQPIALIDAMNEMKPAKHNIFGMNKQQAAYDLALDIYRRFFVEQSTDAANKKVLAETQKLIAKQQEYRKNLNAEYRERFEKLKEQEKTRRDSLKQKYERELDEQRRELSSAMAYRDAKAETEIRKKIKSYEAKLAKVKQQSNDKYMKLKAAQSENRTAKRNIEERRRYRERIRKNAQGIVTAFNQNTDKNHVPDALKKTVADFIDAIDFTTDRTNPNSVDSLKWYNALSQMQLKLSSEREAIAGEYEDIYNALMDGNSGDRKTSSLLDDISDFLNNNEGVRISDMDINGLRYLDRLVSGLKRAITSVNQLYVNERAQNVEELGDNTIEELKTKKDKKVWNNDTLMGKAINKAENMLDANMLDPRSYFYRMGDSALSIYKGLRKGLNTRTEKIAEAQDYMQSQFGKIAEECGLTEKQLKSEMKKWTGRDAEVHKFDFDNKKLRMTTAQMMGLYELKNREQAKEHIKYGGVITTTKAGTKVYRNSEGIRLTEYEVGKICEELTPEQKKVADSMQQFMQNRCSAWGNATTMQMYGYRRFGGQHYYPIKTSGNTVDTKDQTSYWGVKNQGFTKKTMKNARNAIVVDDIFDVFTKHVTDMASYGSYTAALSDAMKWFNYRQKAGLDEHMSEDEMLDILNSKTSVKAQIERAYGKEYQEYFKKLVQDINAEGTGDVQVKFVDELVGNMKAASVAANIRVAIQQPTAYFRAMAVMDSKYLLKALTMKPAVHEVQEKAPIAKWKSWGYFETSIGQSMKEVITDQHTFKEGLQEKSMILAQQADDITWGVLWNAVKQETKALHPDIDVNSKEFTDLCVDRYDELIDQTQVVDSVLHRSQIMRSNNGLHKMATSFMAEPTKSYNMLANALRDWYEMPGKWNAGSKRFFKQTLKAYIITNVVNAAAQSFMDAFRDKKDDDTTYWERWLDDYKDNVVDNLNPVQLIPYMKDILSIAQGYDVNRLDMQGLSKLFAGVRNVQKYATDADYRENHTWLEAAESLMSGISSVTGIPIYNVERDFKAIYNTTTGKYLGGIKRKNSRQYERMLDAYLSEDNAAYKEIEGELKEKGLEKKEITSKVKKEMKDGYLAGDISEKEAKKFLREKAGQSDEEIWCTLEEWNYGETYQRLYDAIDNSINKGADREAIFDYISEAKSKGGKENKDISGVVTREYKKKYLKAKEKGKYADMKNLLISIYMHLGYTNAEANKKIEEWSKKKTK
nr:MAG TPA: PolyVal ADP-Ribosyltransferase [Caudoviricetes sp.]